MSRDLVAEAIWLLDPEHAHFRERPATLREFLDPDYLNIEEMMRPAIIEVLADIIGEEINPERPTKYTLAILTGGIGIGKTTVASVVLAYLVHWTLCLKDPQRFFGLLPGSRIAFMEMSTSEDQAKAVVFGDIKARINHSSWFKAHPFDPKFKNQLHFDPDIWVIPGDSTETTFEGYNILGGVLDEADSHKVTEKQDYAEIGLDTITNRMSSRFEQRGFVMIIGQMKSQSGFAARKLKEFDTLPNAYACRMSIWESRGDRYFQCREVGPHPENRDLRRGQECGQTHKFYFDVQRKEIIPEGVAKRKLSKQILAIPNAYRPQFERNPSKALKDLAGIPPLVGDTFISFDYKILDAEQRWLDRYGDGPPVDPKGRLAPGFRAHDSRPRAAHIDIGYSSEGDGLGFGMGYIDGLVDVEGELKPMIVFDLLLRLHAPPGGEIEIGVIRRLIYELRDRLKFNIKTVTADGFQSTDTLQQLRKRRINAYLLSVDKNTLPYSDLRDALYEDRIAIPTLMARMRPEDDALTDVAYKELSEVIDLGKKVDHPVGGSKDVADTMAAVTCTLMGDRKYRRGVVDLGVYRAERQAQAAGMGVSHPAFRGDFGQAPIPPAFPGRY